MSDKEICNEQTIHQAFAELAQQIATKHGIKVQRVYFNWSDFIHIGEHRLLTTQIESEKVVK